MNKKLALLFVISTNLYCSEKPIQPTLSSDSRIKTFQFNIISRLKLFSATITEALSNIDQYALQHKQFKHAAILCKKELRPHFDTFNSCLKTLPHMSNNQIIINEKYYLALNSLAPCLDSIARLLQINNNDSDEMTVIKSKFQVALRNMDEIYEHLSALEKIHEFFGPEEVFQ